MSRKAVSNATKLHWVFEPHVTTKILHELLAEARVPYHLKAQLNRTRGVHRDGTRITAITLFDGRTFRGRTFIDTTYEGDLMAAAGVSYIVGREANRRYHETLNGVHVHPAERTPPIDPFVRTDDRTSGLLPRVAPRAPGAEGEADAGMQAYNFRVCLTDVVDNRVPEAVRREVGRRGLARDELADTEPWPFQLDVCEARRMLGDYVVTEHDCRRKTTVTDPVAHASYAMDSHVVGNFVDEQGRLRVEGTFPENIRAFPINYRALLSKRTEGTNLIAPGGNV